jgi:hypothetical protein
VPRAALLPGRRGGRTSQECGFSSSMPRSGSGNRAMDEIADEESVNLEK